MKTRSLLFNILACALTYSASLAAQSPQHSVAGDFDTFFKQLIAEQNITGAAFAVVTPGEIIRIGTTGYTDTGKIQPINENTLFRVASVSKTFAAGLSGVLVDEGEFRWEDRVVSHVPDFRIKGDASRVLVRDLLGQSTGLIPHAYDNLIEDGLSMERITDQFSKLSYICEPGDCYSYQNSVFSLIEPVIESSTSRPYDALMYEKIFQPLDMRDASVGYEPLISIPNHAKPHVKVANNRWATVRVKPNYYRVAPAAGVNASVLDMGKWLMAQMGSNPEVLRPGVVETLTDPRVKTRRDLRRKYWRDMLSEAYYGLGWRIYRLGDEELAYHSGWVAGYRADIAWSEKHQLGLAILMNAESNSISELSTTFWRMAFERVPATAGAASLAGASR